MGKRQRPPGIKDYVVGYGRPPEETRFQHGRSGNPKGRPRKPKTVAAVIEEALSKRVKVQENGRSRSLSAEEVIVRRLVHDAAKGDSRAVRMLFTLIARYGHSPAESIEPRDLEADQEILEAYFKRKNAGQSERPPVEGGADPGRDRSGAPSMGEDPEPEEKDP